MVSNFLLIHYNAYYGNIKEFDHLYQSFMQMDESSLKEFPTISNIDKSSYLLPCLERGCSFKLDFAIWVHDNFISNIISEDREPILQAISAKYARNGKFDCELIMSHPPFCLWYPEMISKENCRKLAKVFPKEMSYQVGLLSVLQDWKDVYAILHISPELTINRWGRILKRGWLPVSHKANVLKLPEILDFSGRRLIFNRKTNNVKYEMSDLWDLISDGSHNSSIGVYHDLPQDSDFENGLLYNGDARLHRGTDLYPEDAFLKPQYFEKQFLNLLLHDKEFYYSFDTDQVIDTERILRDTDYALRVFKANPGSYGSICVSRFLAVGFNDTHLINRYKPVSTWGPYFQPILQYKKLIQRHPFLKSPIGRNLILSFNNDLYFELEYEPDIDLFIAASKVNNFPVYKDQLAKSKKRGYFYQNFDFTKQILKPTPTTISLEKVKIKPSFDLNFCLTHPKQVVKESRKRITRSITANARKGGIWGLKAIDEINIQVDGINTDCAIESRKRVTTRVTRATAKNNKKIKIKSI